MRAWEDEHTVYFSAFDSDEACQLAASERVSEQPCVQIDGVCDIDRGVTKANHALDVVRSQRATLGSA